MRSRSKKENLRTQLGLSQDHMALWLGIGRSLYSMYELRQRSLPSDASLKKFKIEQDWKKFEENWIAAAHDETEAPSEDFLFKITVLKHKLKLAKFSMDKLNKLPDYGKARAFFEKRMSETSEPTELVIFRLQIQHLGQEIKRVKKKRKLLGNEIELLELELNLLMKSKNLDENEILK